jgi:hypothetical protein
LARKKQQEEGGEPEVDLGADAQGAETEFSAKTSEDENAEPQEFSPPAKKPRARKSPKTNSTTPLAEAEKSFQPDDEATEESIVENVSVEEESKESSTKIDEVLSGLRLSDADLKELEHKYLKKNTPVSLDVLIGTTADSKMINLKNLFFHTARVFGFSLKGKKFFMALFPESTSNHRSRAPLTLSCDKGSIQVSLDDMNDLSAFEPRLSTFSIGSYPEPIQEMLLNSLLSPLLDRISTLLACKVNAQLGAHAPASGVKFPFSVRIYDENPHEGKEVGLLFSVKVVVDLSLAADLGEIIRQIPTAVLHALPIPFRCKNFISTTTISREDLATLHFGDVIFLENTEAVDAKQTRLVGLTPYEIECKGNGNQLTVTRINAVA